MINGGSQERSLSCSELIMTADDDGEDDDNDDGDERHVH